MPGPASHSKIVLVLLLVSGCGGGGSSSGAPASQVSTPAVATPPAPSVPSSLRFERVATSESGLRRTFAEFSTGLIDRQFFSGGVAAGDYDGDGDVDLYVVGGGREPNHLYRNRGDGTFDEVGVAAGVNVTHWGSGPAFGDIDGDGDLDLFVGSVVRDPWYVFENRLNEAAAAFVDVTNASNVTLTTNNTVSATFFDYDNDGYVDLFLSHWDARWVAGADTQTVWRNNGAGSFVSASIASGVAEGIRQRQVDFSFTPNFSDIDGDGDSDLLLARDFGLSQVYLNNGDATFTDVTDRDVISDQNGMGAAVGDYDNDGDMDWFVTSIYTLDVQDGDLYGNRLYRNHGSAVFEDVTVSAGVDNGGWGWGSCFADFDNDGDLDLFHVNGWNPQFDQDFTQDQVRLFENNGDATFVERAGEIGLDNRGQGRGVVCFDAERDGDVDILITNNGADHLAYYRNQTGQTNHYLNIRLAGAGANRLGIGAWITVTTGSGTADELTQVRELGGHNNYVSHNPYEVHVGLGNADSADVEVRWPDGGITSELGLSVDQAIIIAR